MKTSIKFLSTLFLIAVLAMTFTSPALAFDGRSGENITIKADETVNDDLYVTANKFVLDGTVKGDLIVFGTDIIINGTVEGDLMAAGQTVVINGTIADDARIAGAALQIGKGASIAGDLVAAGASLEAKDGSAVNGELALGAGQALLAGSIDGDALIGTGSLELSGEFGGDVKAEVGEAEQNAGSPSPSMFMPNISISIPTVPPGLTVDKDAKIKGNFEYTQTKDVKIPESVVGGKVTRNEPTVSPEEVVVQPTPTETALKWTLDLVRSIVTLILFGLLLGWLVPAFIKSLIEKAKEKPVASFGWGIVAYAAFFFAILLIIVAMVLGGVIFGALTLGGISGTIIWLGLVAIFAMTVGFVLATSFLSKIVVAWLGGKLILGRFNPSLAENKVWPLVLGVIIVALATALPYVGWIFGLIVLFLGLGALWIWGRDLWANRNTTTAA